MPPRGRARASGMATSVPPSRPLHSPEWPTCVPSLLCPRPAGSLFCEEPAGPAVSCFPFALPHLVQRVRPARNDPEMLSRILAQLDCKLKGLTHAPAFRVHSTALE